MFELLPITMKILLFLLLLSLFSYEMTTGNSAEHRPHQQSRKKGSRGKVMLKLAFPFIFISYLPLMNKRTVFSTF